MIVHVGEFAEVHSWGRGVGGGLAQPLITIVHDCGEFTDAEGGKRQQTQHIFLRTGKSA